MLTAKDDLARTRHAFAAWRANRSGRTRIPHHLWDQAVSLLAHHPITHLARQLRLDPTELRKRRRAMHQPLIPENALAPHFLEVRASSLNSITSPTPSSATRPPRLTPEAAVHLEIKRADGNRLTLSVPSSEWSHIEALYSVFLRA